MVLVTLLTWLGLWLLNVQLALALGLLAGILNFIPNIGPLLSVVPAVLVALPDGVPTVVWVALLYLGVQTIESSLFTPLLQQRMVSLPPAFTLTMQLLFWLMLGGWGLVLATPIAAAGVVFVQRLYVEDILERPESERDGARSDMAPVG